MRSGPKEGIGFISRGTSTKPRFPKRVDSEIEIVQVSDASREPPIDERQAVVDEELTLPQKSDDLR
jgi:hypothetical protein